MKKIFIIFLFLISVAYPQQFNLAWLSDIHIGYPTAEQDLINSVNDINANDEIEFTVISGDITATGTLNELSKAKSLLDKLNKPYYIIPGNHDTKWSESGCTDFIKLWGNDRFVFEKDGFLFIGLHQGPRMRMADGHFAPEDLRWFDDFFESDLYADKKLIFITHYPLDESISNWYEMLNRLKRLNTKLVLFGHGHSNKVYDFISFTGIMGRSNLSGTNKSSGYNIISVIDDSVFFYERTSSETNLWHKLKLESLQKDSSSNGDIAVDFSINDLYPDVKPLWKFNTGFTIGSSASVNDESIFIGDASGYFYSLSYNDGTANWKFRTDGPIYSTSALMDSFIVFGSADSSVYCLSNVTGSLIWKYKTNAAVLGSPLIWENTVYIGGSDHSFYAFELKSGKLIWKFSELIGFVETQPVFYKGKILFGAWDEYFYCLDARLGKLIWKWKSDREGIFYSPAVCKPVISGGIVFIVQPDRKITAIDIESGNELWRTGKYQVRETIGISNDSSRIFIRTMNDSILAIPASKELKDPLWITNCGFGYDISSAQIIEKDGMIFYPTKNGVIYSLDSSKGKILWKYKVTNSFVNTLTVIDKNRVIATDFDGNITLLIAKE